jgi:hypothetical protein
MCDNPLDASGLPEIRSNEPEKTLESRDHPEK